MRADMCTDRSMKVAYKDVGPEYGWTACSDEVIGAYQS